MKNFDLFTLSFLILLQVSKLNCESDSVKNSKESNGSPLTDVSAALPSNSENASNSSMNITQAILPFDETVNGTTIFRNGISTDAVFRGFYVFLALGFVFLLYISVKTFRLRRHRASNRYKVISTKAEDRESFFPLAAEDGEEEEIFNAASRQNYS